MAVISVHELRMSYGRVQAVKGISFEVDQGAFFAFLGANGAGKSTTINCLTTLLRPSGGEASVAGFDLGRGNDQIRRHIGVVFQAALLDPRLTVRENLAMRARFHGLNQRSSAARIDELAGLLELGDFADRQYRRLSGGQKRRADIARALIHRPSVLFLDEPTAGLDPRSREQVWQAIADVRQHEGMTVFLTTHYMEETERADQVSVIDAGLLVARGTPAQLRQRHSTGELSLYVSDVPAVVELLAGSFPSSDISQPAAPGDPVKLAVKSTGQVKWLMPYLMDYIDDFEYRHGSMDDVFLTLTGHRGDDDASAGADRAGRRRRRRQAAQPKGKRARPETGAL